MAETAGPFDTTPWSQDQWYRFAGAWAPSGVLDYPPSFGGLYGLSFFPSTSGLTLTISAGRAWVRGGGYENTAPKALSVPANTNASPRIDRLVVRRDLAAKTIGLVILQGTPAASPAAPALTQVEAGQWDLPLWRWTTPASSGTTLTGFTDERVWIDPDYVLGRFGGLTLTKLTQAAYDAIGTKDAGTLYVIVG